MDFSIIPEKLNNAFNTVKTSVSTKKKSVYREFRDMGLSRIDSAFSSIYINACESNAKTRRMLEKISRPLSVFSSTAKGLIKRDKVGLFSDSSLEIVTKALAFLKKRVSIAFAAALAVVLCSMISANNSQIPSLEVYVNGVSIGCVESADKLDSVLERVEQRVTDVTGECYDLPCTITYSLNNSSVSVLADDELYAILNSYTQDETCNAYGLYIDNREVAVLRNRQDITFVISTLEAQHLALTGENAHISNRVTVKYEEYASDKVISRTQLMNLLKAVQPEEEKRLLSSAGTEAVITEASNTVEETSLSESIANSLSPTSDNTVVITYETVSFETKREYIDYPVRYLEDTSLYQGQTKISTYGRRGLADVTYSVSTVDGEEISRVQNSINYIYEPVTQVVKVGTKALPETYSEEITGGKYMIYPLVSFKQSDKYGSRYLNGRYDFHYGFDMAANNGTPIYAAASGEVILAGYNGSFGYCVKIEHADGTVTLYAHCSELLVKVGDTVAQGQLIAEVGNTGYSFGNHCHFEVIVNGTRVNPEDYIYQE